MHYKSRDKDHPCETDAEEPPSVACAAYFTTAAGEVVIYDERLHTSWVSATNAVSLDSVR